MVFCSMIRSLLFLHLILTALPVDARPELRIEENKENSTEITRDTEMINLGRDIGWIDATCSWFGWGILVLRIPRQVFWLSQKKSKKSMGLICMHGLLSELQRDIQAVNQCFQAYNCLFSFMLTQI